MKEDKEKKRIGEDKTKKGEELAVRAVNPCEFLTKLGKGELGADVRTDLWHRYRDRTWFRYEVVISRIEGKVERRFELSVRLFPFCFLFGVGLKGGVTHLSPFPTHPANFIPHMSNTSHPSIHPCQLKHPKHPN